MAGASEDVLETVSPYCDDEWLAVNFQEAGESSPGTSSCLQFQVCVEESGQQVVISCSDLDGDDSDEQKSWEVTCTLEKVEQKHSELIALFPVVSIELPVLPKRPSGIWGYLFAFKIPDDLCGQLEEYLRSVTVQCGKKIILETFFGVETSTADSFLLSLADFDKSKLSDAVEEAKKTLVQASEMREQVTTAEELVSVYEIEDAAVMELDRQEMKLSEFEERPFSHVRDVEHRQRHLHHQNSLDASLSRQEQLTSVKKERESNEEYLFSHSTLLDLQEGKYKAMAERTQQCIERMLKDKDRFGPSWETHGADWMKSMEEKMVIMTVELLKVRCKKLRLEKDRKLMEIATVEESGDLDETVKMKEKEFYELHMKWIDVMLMLLNEQEKQVRFEIGRQTDSQRVEKLKEKERKLSSKKSKFRNQKRHCDAAVQKKSYQWIYSEKSTAALQAGQKKQEVERLNTEKLKQRKVEERKRAIDRIQMYKEKNPTPVVRKPPRYLPPSQLKPKQDRKKTPTASSSSIMSSSMASIRASAVTAKTTPKTTPKQKGKDQPRDAAKTSQNEPPTVPPPPTDVEAKLVALATIDPSTMPPAPMPPAPPTAPPIPPAAPPLPLALPLIRETSPTSTLHLEAKPQVKEPPQAAKKKETRMAPGVFDAESILAARKSLKVTGFSKALAGGVNEMKVLLRAGVKEADDGNLSPKASLSDTNAKALSAALDRMKPFTSGDSDESDSSDDD